MSRSHAGRRIGRAAIVALLALTAIGATAVGLGASAAAAAPAAAPNLSVNPANNLDPNGAFVVVSGTGFLPNVQLFVMQCRATSTTDHTCNSVGLRKVTTSPQGTFTANAMKVVANFGATDCLKVQCAIKTSAVSDHADDRSQDRNTNIAFRAPAPPPPTAPPVTAPPPTPVPQTAPPAPPTTAPPAAVTTTTAKSDDPKATTTTKAGDDDPKATTTTKAGKDDEGDDDIEVADESVDATAAGSDGESAAGAATGQTPGDDGDGGSSPIVPILIVVALAAAGIGGYVVVRRRGAVPEP